MIFLKGYSRGYVNNENVEQVCRIHVHILRQIDGYLLFLQKVDPTRESIRESKYFVAESMKTWSKLGISVTPKEFFLKTMQ